MTVAPASCLRTSSVGLGVEARLDEAHQLPEAVDRLAVDRQDFVACLEPRPLRRAALHHGTDHGGHPRRPEFEAQPRKQGIGLREFSAAIAHDEGHVAVAPCRAGHPHHYRAIADADPRKSPSKAASRVATGLSPTRCDEVVRA